MFKDKIVLITGGSSGIGMTTAILFAEKGADIAITYKSNKKGADEVVDKIKKIGGKAIAIKADLTKEDNAKKVVEKTIKKFGRIDILINNAGRYVDGDEWDGDSKIWLESIKQNLISVMSMSKYAAKEFQKQRSGVIVNIASIIGTSGLADAISYGASKAGIINITQAYSKLLTSFDCRVNSVSPSAVNVGYWLTAPKDELEERLAITPNHRLIEPNEVAEKIIFLASDEAKNIKGQNFILE